LRAGFVALAGTPGGELAGAAVLALEAVALVVDKALPVPLVGTD